MLVSRGQNLASQIGLTSGCRLTWYTYVGWMTMAIPSTKSTYSQQKKLEFNMKLFFLSALRLISHLVLSADEGEDM